MYEVNHMEKSVCFSGYRPTKFNYTAENKKEPLEIKQFIFYVGMVLFGRLNLIDSQCWYCSIWPA